MSSNIEDEVILVSDVGTRLGMATAEILCDAGAIVFVHAGDPGASEAARVALGLPSSQCISQPLEEDGAWSAVLGELPTLHGVVCTAAPGTTSQADRVGGIASTVLRPYRLVSEVAPFLAQRGYGRVVLATSPAGLFGLAGQLEYTVGAAATIGMVRAVAPGLRSNGVMVNAVATLTIEDPVVQDAASAPQLYDPRHAAKAMAYLASRDCRLAGEVLSAGAGRFARLFSASTVGVMDPAATPAAIGERLDAITDTAHFVTMRTAADEILLVEV